MAPDFASSSGLTQLVAAFNAGILTSFTPCIYPLIPITLAIFGASTQPSRSRSFLLALCYVLGIATTYTALGMISAKTGGLFGSALTKPPVIAVLTVLLIGLALFSLDAIKLKGVSKVQDAASRIGGKGFRGAFLMGTVSGFVAAPCAGPMLVVILGIAAAQGNTFWGALLLFTYALGMGILFLLLGLFPNLLKALPRSGNWLHAVKFFTAALLLAVALFISQPYHLPLLAPLLASRGVVVGLFAVSLLAAYWGYHKPNALIKICASVIFATSAFYLVLGPSARHSASQSNLTWASSIDEGLKSAHERSTIVMADLYADWCAACKELDSKTFSQEAVRARLGKLSLVRVDFTVSDPTTDKVSERFQVTGLPCILFLRADGQEIPDSRITGFVEPQEFLKHLDQVASGAQP